LAITVELRDVLSRGQLELSGSNHGCVAWQTASSLEHTDAAAAAPAASANAADDVLLKEDGTREERK
jgi:hypothetical protein